ncbi:tetratricopeptide repeat protein [Myroides odoratimimus]|uniref:helix-turn-helix transcriptional regulator n=1 Tax=Myroides odoratimimus TaxID=76832 RepID=UPI00257864CC|nr:tetratricopeptide repeat protein [Myroides odoratimimus]MDM1097740.1 tetratricopeptide repeat protein [Myroides odoratimimus]MDM1328119.1 tetratricopeptide repeat protein [Myroides odoratimimus]MDM1444705.1 tetratricopeptide repeat protein [Myroides odoratimimus]MDM1513743.1 tetratricopeptide repeat protein [Myroides odoratimimus]MDO5858525.1 tetratricopeptide repeat protein [Myroides odoratimimus]
MTTKLFAFFLFLFIVACTDTKYLDNQQYDILINEYYKTGTVEVDDIENIAERNVIGNILKGLSHLEVTDSINDITTSLFLESVSMVEKSSNVALKEWVYSEVGFYYYSYNYYYEASPYFIKIAKTLENESIVLDVQAKKIFLRTAYFFETINMNESALIYYKKALAEAKKEKISNSAILWGLGAVYSKVDSLEQSMYYYELAKETSLSYKDTLRYAKSLGGIASVYRKQGDIEKAELYLKEDIAISQQLGEERNLMYSQIQLGKLYIDLKQYDLAEEVLKKSYEITITKSYLAGFEREIISYLLDIAKARGIDTEELFYRRELDQIDSMIEAREGDEVINKINWNTNLERVNWELEAERSFSERVRYQRLLLLSTTVLLTLILCMVYFFYKRILKLQKYAYEGKLLDFQLSKINSENKLKETKASLASYQVYLSEKTAQIAKLEHELNKASHSSKEIFKEKRPAIEELLRSHLMTEENWVLFKETFRAEQAVYFNEIITQFPDLTESNLRIVLLQKMGLTNQETANILGVTIDAVKKAKQRLKKKFEDDYSTLFSKE